MPHSRPTEWLFQCPDRPDHRQGARVHPGVGREPGTSWDVGNGVLYLARDDARWVTGAVLPIDAGATAGAGRLPIPASDGKPS